ncbi:acyltransferase [Acinetobacter sp. YH12110]|uniref:acyltransferase family protein n=5 Tax=unclassified Acinetobacter TaxID=196816 RepID=UPI0015D1D24F|nr:acyltransferase [Acinetobacter sp. YH12110]
MSNYRARFIDVAKGISIILMTLTHLQFVKKYDLIESFNYDYLILFKMPMFIIISGYLFNTKKNLNYFLFSKFDSLIKPATSVIFIFYLISLIPYILGLINYPNPIKILGIFTPLWFIFSLFLSLVLFRFIFYIFEKYQIKIAFFTTISLLIVLASLNEFDIRYSIFNLSTIIYFLIYLSIGYIIKKNDFFKYVIDYKSTLILVILFSTIFVTKDLFDIKIRMFSNVYSPFLFALIYSLCGAMMVISISNHIIKYNLIQSFLKKCGECSFFILAFHSVIGNFVFNKILNYFKIENILVDIVAFFLVIYICVILRDIFYNNTYTRLLFFPKPKSVK